ncbi:CLUMA_CG019845, isoform A [Clunio marinus]|uniref:CLUMA_CG019845, isoform A n=1 Tax=Clunio marinus TaxID=568069 RepID=A0A1J1J2X4_9DIPT|nr:CLUMA_CG019845, isoform A [Clunio marinus]
MKIISHELSMEHAKHDVTHTWGSISIRHSSFDRKIKGEGGDEEEIKKRRVHAYTKRSSIKAKHNCLLIFYCFSLMLYGMLHVDTSKRAAYWILMHTEQQEE